ncbi:pullulanase [Paenibacillus pasadenensis]|uniref:pullulanase n=1 Tax=Paenibacillus pasadenensis TaxID=217090 RepID=UPI00203BFE48|nr:pullulanase [Paenibacillus pasadenensis]MCM3748109.1 pullulanase [Paenibacillus pasadenensis]
MKSFRVRNGRRLAAVIVVMSMLMSMFAPAPAQVNAASGAEPPANPAVAPQNTAPAIPDNHLRVHYKRSDGIYKDWGLWTFDDVASPSTNWPSSATPFPEGQTDSFGAYIDIPLKDGASKVGLITMRPSNGEKDGGDKKFALNGMKEVWLLQSSDTVYTDEPAEPKAELVFAEVLDAGKLRLNFTMTGDLEADSLKTELQITDKSGAAAAVDRVEIVSDKTADAYGSFTMDQAPLTVHYDGKKAVAFVAGSKMDELYAYNGGDLGATYADGGAVLKLWAPLASSVTVTVYDKTDASLPIGGKALDKGERGVWSAELKPGDFGVADFKNYFYQYEVTNNGVTKTVLDPYAKSMAEFRVNTKGEAGPDGDTVGKAAIVDLSGTDPEGFGFADVQGYEKREDAVIWEIHVRDFTSDSSIENSLNGARWGSFDAFKQKLDYIKSLGVTHVQLLPVMAWYYGDEAAAGNRETNYSAKNNEYNWGYDPHSYFAPDGAYSANPKDPELRVKELKAMIDAIHDEGMGVILDVVYTHMAKADFLQDIVPNYYAFQNASGAFLGDFGNNLATNRKMAEKLMVDSVKYWFDEYKIDGMRFDMMGDATYDSVQNAYDAAKALNPQALFIGEGWRTFKGAQADPSLAGKGADQDWMDKTNDVGVFSDEFRNELKSGFGSEGEPRFITGGARDINTIFNNIKAQPGNTNEDDPGDMVQYTEAHDNLTLYDIIAQATKKDPAVEANNKEIHQRLRLGNLMTLTSQGTAFLHAGQEYGRTKQWLAAGQPEGEAHEFKDADDKTFGYFVHNSYDSSDAINRFDWQKATDAAAYPENAMTRDYTQGLIELRQSSNAFRLGDQSLVNRNVKLLSIPEVQAQDLVIAYKTQSTDGTGAYYVFINADSKARKLTLSEDLSGGLVVADSDEAGIAGVAAPSGFKLDAGSIELSPLTAVIIRTEAQEEPETDKRYVQFNYIRPDKDYKDWNLWVWNTGVKNDQIDFDKVENGIAQVLIEVAPQATSVGFVLRKGTDWNTAKQDIGDDRIIPLTPGEAFTKVNVTSMVRELDIKPTLTGPALNDGAITFTYRDDKLFREGKQNLLESVQLQIGGKQYPMAYMPELELFRYTLEDIAPGTYDYTFAVTQGGATTVVSDPKNTEDGKSAVSYIKPNVTISASVAPSAITSGENALVKLNVASSEEVAFKEGYMDLTALGGPAKVKLDTALLEQTIAVKDTVTAGEKKIPLTLVDQYGNRHKGEAGVTVKARRAAGGKLDFDFDESRIYFVLTDRFMDGDASNNENVDKSHLEAYHGGDFQGLIDKLDYIEQLGVNTLWITPIVDNIDFNKGTDFNGKQYGYHGYWAKDFSKLDEHLGDLDTFKELIDKAHDRGIKIMVDVVLNHAGYGVKPGDNAPGVTEEDKARFAEMLRTDGLSADTDAIKGELAGLPDFITEDPAVRKQVIDWQTEWLKRAKTERGDTIDFFRVDTVKHVEETTWKAFKNDLTAIDPDFKLIGEYYGATADSDGGALQSGQMDSLLDFSFNDRAKQFVEGGVEAVDVYLAERAAKLDNTRTMGQFLSSHDEDGFLSDFIGGDKAKLMAAAALQITAKGQPVIYYGEELGRSGKNAKDMGKGELSENRSDMPWDKLDEEGKLLQHYRKLLAIRADYSKVYSKGERTTIEASDEKGYMAFSNKYGEQQVVTALGVKASAQEVTLKVPFAAGSSVKELYSGQTLTVSADGQITFTLPAMADGGTAIFAAVTPDGGNGNNPDPGNGGNPDPGNGNGGNPDPGNGNGGDPGSSNGGTTPGTGGADPQPGSVKVVTEDMLRAAGDTVSITLGADVSEVQLPLNASGLLDGKPLELKREGTTVQLPAALLKSLQELVPAGDAAGAFISFKVAEVDAQTAAALVAQAGEEQKAKLKLGSGMLELELAAVGSGGKTYKLDRFAAPVTLSLPVANGMNGKLAGIYFISESGIHYVGGRLANGVMTAKLSHFSKYAVLELDKSFRDLTGHWAEAAVKQLAAKGIVNGTSAELFTPGKPVTRAEFTAMLVRALKLEASGTAAAGFKDVPSQAWYASAVAAAQQHGLVSGKSADSFQPDAPISREEMALMLMRAYDAQTDAAVTESGVKSSPKDMKDVSAWAVNGVREALALGIMKGYSDGKFLPEGVTNRAESAQAVFNMMSKLES